MLALALAACADEGPVSGPGTLTATLVSPNGAEGAAHVVLLGEGIGAITPLGSTEVHSRTGVEGTHVVLVDPAGGTLAFQIAVADTTQPPAVVIQQVAGPDDALRSGLEAYRLELGR